MKEKDFDDNELVEHERQIEGIWKKWQILREEYKGGDESVQCALVGWRCIIMIVFHAATADEDDHDHDHDDCADQRRFLLSLVSEFVIISIQSLYKICVPVWWEMIAVLRW